MDHHYKAFFEEVDKPKKRSAWKTCGIIFLFLFFLFIAGMGILFYLIFYPAEPIQRIDYSQKSYDLLINNLPSEDNPNIPSRVEIDSVGLTSLLVKGAEGKNQTLSSVQGIINTETVSFYAKTEKPIRTSVSLDVAPELINDKLSLEIVKVKIGKFSVPKILTNQINKRYKSSITDFINMGELDFQDIELRDDKMVLTLTFIPEPKEKNSETQL